MDLRGRSRLPLVLVQTLLLLNVLGEACFTGSRPPPEVSSQMKVAHKCTATTYYDEDTPFSNTEFWTCIYEMEASLHLAPNCSSNFVDAGVNLTRGITMKVNCSLVPTFSQVAEEYYYEWRIAAPQGSQVIINVPDYNDANSITAEDADSANAYTFSGRSLFISGDYFLSSSNTVFVEVELSNSAGNQDFVITAKPLNIIDTINVTDSSHDCTPPVSGENQWDVGTGFGTSYFFGDSYYQFNSQMTYSLLQAKSQCDMNNYHLVFIESEKEQMFLAITAGNIDSQCDDDDGCGYWIGLTRNTYGDQVWMDGSALTYSNIYDGQFGLNEGGRCFRLTRNLDYRWADRLCNGILQTSARYGYICERERGYHGTDSSDVGCITFKGTTSIDENNVGGVLLMFSYTIKTYQNTVIVWTGSHVTQCLSNNYDESQDTFQTSGLGVDVWCNYSSTAPNSWMVNLQAKGVGLVQISKVQLLVYEEEPPLTITAEPTKSSAPIASTVLISTQTNQDGSVSSPSLNTEASSFTSHSSSPYGTIWIAPPRSQGTSTPSSPLSELSQSSTSAMTTNGESRPSHSSSPYGTIWIAPPRSQGTSTPPSPLSELSQSSTPAMTTNGEAKPDEDPLLSGSNGVIITVVLVLLVAILVAFTAGFIVWKRRRKVSTSSDKPQLKSTEGSVMNPAFENDNDEQHDYAEFTNSVKGHSKPDKAVTSSEEVQKHEYIDLPTSALPINNPNMTIYNEVGEQDYNVLFGGKERGDYHEYNLPDSERIKPNTKENTTKNSYQEVSLDTRGISSNGTEMKDIEQKTLDHKKKIADPNKTADHAYQDLRKDNNSYTSLQVGSNPKPVSTAAGPEIENNYQALKTDGPEYYTLETNKAEQSLNTDKVEDSKYQSLRQEDGPDYAILEHEEHDIRLNPYTPADNTYQTLMKDVNRAEESVSEPHKGSSDPYDVLQRGNMANEPLSLDGYGSLGNIAKSQEDMDYESPDTTPKTTPDYEVPTQNNSVADATYDHLQRNNVSVPQTPDSNDYETPDGQADDTTYQTIDNPQEKPDEEYGEYSKLQRQLGTKPSSELSGISHSGNVYGKLNLN